MSTEIDRDATQILRVLATAPRNEYVTGPQLATETGLHPDRINDAVALLVNAGNAEWIQVMGTAPFDFGDVMITSRGRHEIQRQTQPPPVGSLTAINQSNRNFFSRTVDCPNRSQL
jgi:hypothetical protein